MKPVANSRRIVARYLSAVSAQYEQALKTVNKAQQEYEQAAKAYRAGKIDDDKFMAARKAKAQADKAFDEAFEAESNREEEDSAKEDNTPERQVPLFG